MDKKNTMLLTVIAVATLLVAVVGATFAYFSVSNSTVTGTTVDATVSQVGTVTLSGGADLDLTVTAADMAQSAAPATYSLGSATVAKAELVGNGNDETYYCQFTLNVANASTTNASEETDGGIALTVHEGLTFVGENSLTSATRLNPKEIESKTYTVRFTMGNDGTVASGADLITISGNILNDATDHTQATRLANTIIDLDYTVSGFSCDTADYPA